ncbi:endoplasmic reticulum oxidoreductin 1 family protein [Volvox carteri f. nagariensis]|uniref:Endoplasmic reticulum oxidoreductin 1 family protein n=1 Tax=Volvox carteri f. nagariensis TaxID=3068 RepID=D8THH0_VOLCA|nr:endoplasmic reticulum oxidoreductin 1 family protein [Volvox carteri f. nagariensis]EFJ53070.1 endoplasmic reticulum oxidoreductin 1 family protein [Volvox carteri f. nagariensis]|eukprot:XP_002946075.1 endoplasmic reticulum oxidoreductin 1 family protein [Volvox carteri f. nagariensis]
MAANELVAGESCKLSGHVDECCNCTYQDVDRLNAVVQPLLRQLVRTAFFRYFKVNIYCDCPLWPDDSMCSLRACSVCECEQAEVPQTWRREEEEGWCNTNQCAAELDSRVDSTVDPDTALRLLNLKGWRGFNNPWMAEPEGADDYQYVNLLINPERYTGYAGEHAHRIWNAIYSQICFQQQSPSPATSSFSSSSLPTISLAVPTISLASDQMCTEKRVFYRLISGMHASISAHISANYLLDEERGLWGHNLTDFRKRLGSPELRYRVENLYFAYLFVLRAVTKAGPLLARYEYVTGLEEEDAATAALMKQLVELPELRPSCPMPFDEGRLWKGSDGLALREELRSAFINITRIMDCVGCEKCKLWGKLQTLGVATALKVLFSSSDCSGTLPTSPVLSTLVLERNEVIALVNLLERFSASIEYYRHLSEELQALEGAEAAPLVVASGEPVA